MRGFRVLTVTLTAVAFLAIPAIASGAIKIQRIAFDPSGADTGSNASLRREFIVLENTGNRDVDLTDWTIRDADRHVYRFGDFTLGAGDTVKLRTGSGGDTASTVYWDMGNYVWNNDGDTATLRDARNSRRDTCRYSGSGSSVTC